MIRFEFLNHRMAPLVVDHDDPLDINDTAINIKRSKSKQGLSFSILLTNKFIEDARNYIQASFETDGGLDAVVTANVYERIPNLRTWKLRMSGTVNMQSYDLGEEDLTVDIDQQGLQLIVELLSDLQIDLESKLAKNGNPLPNQTVFTIDLHSKTILLQNKMIPETFLQFLQADVFTFTLPAGFGTIDRDNVVYAELSNSGEVDDTFDVDFPLSNVAIGGTDSAEIENTFKQPFVFSDFNSQLNNGVAVGTVPDYQSFLSDPDFKDNRFNKIGFKNAGLTDLNLVLNLQFQIRVELLVFEILYQIRNVECHAWFEWRDKNDNIKSVNHIGQWLVTMEAVTDIDNTYWYKNSETKSVTFSMLNMDVQVGDKFYIYGTVRHWGSFDRPDPSLHHDLAITAFDGTYINIKQKSKAPVTQARGVMLHEAFERCVQYITGQVTCFRSTLLGRTDIGYDVDGKYSTILFSDGKNMRGQIPHTFNPDLPLTDTFPIITSLNELYNFVNVLTPIGIGYELDENNNMIMVLEEVAYFYDKDTIMVDLGAILGIRKKVNMDRYFNVIKIGYDTKMDVSEVNAIDEYNTTRTYNLSLSNCKNSLTVTTPVVTSGYIIETQRRYNTSTKDSRYDGNKFAVFCVRDGDGFKSKSNEGFDIIENVFDPATGYNYDITPTRCLQNWLLICSSSLVYAVKKLATFANGEFNYTLVTKKNTESKQIAENQTFDLKDIVPLYDNLDYVFPSPITLEQLDAMGPNPKGKIQIRDSKGNIMQGFISTDGIQYKDDEVTTLTLMKYK